MTTHSQEQEAKDRAEEDRKRRAEGLANEEQARIDRDEKRVEQGEPPIGAGPERDLTALRSEGVNVDAMTDGPSPTAAAQKTIEKAEAKAEAKDESKDKAKQPVKTVVRNATPVPPIPPRDTPVLAPSHETDTKTNAQRAKAQAEAVKPSDDAHPPKDAA